MYKIKPGRSVAMTALVVALVSGPVGAAEPAVGIKPELSAPIIEKASKSKAETGDKKASLKRLPAADLLKDQTAKITPASSGGKDSATRSKVTPPLLKTPRGSTASPKPKLMPQLPSVLEKGAMPKAGMVSLDKKEAGVRLPGSGLPKLPGKLEKAPGKPSGGAIGNELPLPGALGKQQPIAGDQAPQIKVPQLPVRPGGSGSKLPTTPRTLRPDLLGPNAPSAARFQPRKGWAAPGVARDPGARVRAAGAALQDLMQVRREGARGTVRVREVRLEDGRMAPDGWRDWQAVAVLENTDPNQPAAVQVFAWGRMNPWVRRTALEGRPQPRVGVYDLGWHILKPRQILRVRLRQPVTWGECVRVWLGGEGARRPVRGKPTLATSGAVEACKGLPQRWRVTLLMGIHEIYEDGDNESPTRWKACLDLDGQRSCNWFTVYDGQRRAGYWLSVEKTYGTSALRGRSRNASLKVVDYDDLLHGGEDDVAHANLSAGVPGLRWPERPYDTLRLRAGVYRQGEFSSGVDRMEGPSGRYQTFATYEPLE